METESSINTQAHGNCDHEEEEDDLRRKLKFFFMNPCEKWRAKKKFPWKLVLQLVKIVLVTIQLAIFGWSRSSHVNFLDKTSVTFKHLFLKGWESSYETMPYPPASGPFSLYTKTEFYASVDHSLNQYNQTEDIAIGTYHFAHENDTQEVNMCITRYRMGKIWPNQTYEFDSHTIRDCFRVHPVLVHDAASNTSVLKYDIKVFLKSINKTLMFDRLVKVEVSFSLRSVHLRGLARSTTPDCYRFDITITYDNSGHNGMILIGLTTSEITFLCNGKIIYESNEELLVAINSVFDVVVILTSVLSMLLCIRSIHRGRMLHMKTVNFFKHALKKKLSRDDQLTFLNCWYVLIVLNDVLTVVGSIYKILIENKISHDYEVCGVTLGTGNLLVWFGLLRYLGFFEKYNVLILTMKKSAPNILRFLVCAGVFYFGFTVCGWVVLGPYHLKFRSLSTASECLFSLINGDDMFVTFAAISADAKGYVWYYSRAYLYVFIALFIYVVLSVFISVIMDTYETIKDHYQHGFPKSDLQLFIDVCTDEPQELFRSNSQPPQDGCFSWMCNVCRQPRNRTTETPNERTSLIS